MKFPTGPWSITHEGARQVLAAIAKMSDSIAPNAAERRPKLDAWGQELPSMRMENGIAIVPLKGVMMNEAEPMYKRFGFVSHQDVAADLETAAAASPRAIILDIDSPGGTVLGTPELADVVRGISQSGPTLLAFTNNVMGSAAYYAAASAVRIYSTPSAIVGSIGTLIEHLDASEYLNNSGIKVERFASGKYKGMGSPEIPLTDEQRAYLTAFVEESGGTFKSYVQEHRPSVDGETMEGQIFTGQKGVTVGLVDELVSGMSEIIKLFGP